MSKLTVAIGAMALAGCASMGEWRTLTVDSSSEEAFAESIARLHDELPPGREQMFVLALVDIARTGVQTAGRTEDGSSVYTDRDFHAELDGLTYEGVVALADRTGTPIWKQYYSGVRPPAAAYSNPQPYNGNTQLERVSNAGLILTDAWKEPGFSPGNFSPLD